MKANRAIDLSLIAVLIVVLITGITLFGAQQRRTEEQATGHLKTMLMLRESVLQSYFESLRSEVALWSSRPVVSDVLERLSRAQADNDNESLRSIGSIDIETLGTNNSRDNVPLDQRTREFAEHHQYYDVFFISPAGDILYTLAKEADYGTNLIDGPYADSGLGRLFRNLLDSEEDLIALEDFSLYAPSNNEAAAFLGARVLSDGRFIGVYAIQIPQQPINEIMQFSAGMGETGETYLVGEDGLMRSTSRFFDTSTVLSTSVSAATVGKALQGQVGLEIAEDYRGEPVYSAYRLFEFEELRWAVLAEQDVAEIEGPLNSARLWLAGAFVLLCLITLMLRFMLIRVVLPASLAALLGLSFMHMDDSD